MKLFYMQVRRLVLLSGIILFCSNLFGQTTYTWSAAGGGSWATAGNWTPSRGAPAANDILRFTSGTRVITSVPTQTIGKLQITGNANITLTAVNTGNVILTASTAAVDAIDVDAGSTLQLVGIRQGASEYSLTLTTANTVGLEANIDGTLKVTREAVNRPGTFGVFTKGGANAIIRFNSGSIYTHDVEGSLIPVSTWNATSTCNITGLTNTAPSGLNQSFGHFTYDCPDHATLINFNSALASIAGNFTVRYAGEEQGVRTLNGLALSSTIDFTLNIGGNLVVDHYSSEATWLIMATGDADVTINVAGNFLMSNTGVSGSCYFDYKQGSGTAMGVLVVNVTGNLTMTGGYFDMAFQASSYSVATELRLTGNLSVSANSTIISSGTSLVNGKIIFNKAGTQTIFEGAAGVTAYVNYQVNSGSTTEFLSNFYLYDYITAIKSGGFTVLSGGIVDMNTYILHSYNVAAGSINVVGTYTSFALNSGAGIITAKAEGVHRIGFINGSISAAIGTRTFSSGANYTYDGVVIQNSGTFVTTPVANQVNNLTISNTAGKFTNGVTLEQAIAVAGVCTFNVGALTTTSILILTINDNATAVGANNNALPSFANGPVRKVGNEAISFPIGKVASATWSAYRYCTISAPANVTDTFTAEFMRAPATLLGPITDPLIYAVSFCEYWKIDRGVTSSSVVDVTLTWTSLYSSCNAIVYVSSFADIAIAHFNGTSWNSHGGAYNLGSTNSDGTVTWAGVSVFSPFSLTTLSPFTNPLPIKLTSINAYKIQGGNKVEWSNLTEQGVNIYELEKSADGRTFDVVNAQQAKKNNGSKADYNWIDVNPFSSITYYRIRAIERTGNVLYSPVVKVQTGGNIKDGFIVYPNPVLAKQFTVQLSSPAGLYKIKLINNFGQEIMSTQWQHLGGSASKTIELNPSVSAGIYHLQITGGNQIMQSKILIQ